MRESMLMDGKSIRPARLFAQLIAVSWHKEGVRVGQNGTRGTKYGLDCNASGKPKCTLIRTMPVLSFPKHVSTYRERRTNVVFLHRRTCRVELKLTMKHPQRVPTTMSRSHRTLLFERIAMRSFPFCPPHLHLHHARAIGVLSGRIAS